MTPYPYRVPDPPQDPRPRWFLRCWLGRHDWTEPEIYEVRHDPEPMQWHPDFPALIPSRRSSDLGPVFVRVRVKSVAIRRCRRCGVEGIERHENETVIDVDGFVVRNHTREVQLGPDYG